MKSVYKRIILKVSGEALQDENDHSIYDRKKLEMIADVVKEACDAGTQVGIVVGAGNIWRGRMSDKIGIEQAQGDYMGMLGTIMNAMAIQNAVELKNIECRVMSAINVPQCCEPYIRRKAVHHLEKGRVVVFAGGTGNPYFTTDSCATLRALEVGADAILMAKNGSVLVSTKSSTDSSGSWTSPLWRCYREKTYKSAYLTWTNAPTSRKF